MRELETSMTRAQISVESLNVTLGPFLLSFFSYQTSRSAEKGLAHVIAAGNAPGLVNPVLLDVNKPKKPARANSYPNQWNAIENAIDTVAYNLGVHTVGL